MGNTLGTHHQAMCTGLPKNLCGKSLATASDLASKPDVMPGLCTWQGNKGCTAKTWKNYCKNQVAAGCGANPGCRPIKVQDSTKGIEVLCLPDQKRWVPYTINKFLNDLILIIVTAAILFVAYEVITYITYVTPVRPHAMVTQPQVTRTRVKYSGSDTPSTAYLCSGGSECRTISPYLTCTPTGMDGPTATDTTNAHQGAATTCTSNGRAGTSAKVKADNTSELRDQQHACSTQKLEGLNQCMWNPDYVVRTTEQDGTYTYDTSIACQPVFTGALYNAQTKKFGDVRQWKECRVPIPKNKDELKDSNPAAYNAFTACVGAAQESQPLVKGRNTFPSVDAFEKSCNTCCTSTNAQFGAWKYMGSTCSQMVKKQMKKYGK